MDLSLEYYRGLTGLHWRKDGFGTSVVAFIEDLYFEWICPQSVTWACPESEKYKHKMGAVSTLAVLDGENDPIFEEKHFEDQCYEKGCFEEKWAGANIRTWEKWLEWI